MNVTGFIRGYMSKNMSGEKFLEVVARTMEMQLKEWDENYEVMVMKLINYEFVIKNQDTYYHIELSEDELKSLQDRGDSPWTEVCGLNSKSRDFN